MIIIVILNKKLKCAAQVDLSQVYNLESAITKCRDMSGKPLINKRAKGADR